MKPLALDTPLHVEQRWIAGLRAKGVLWRLQRLVSITHFCWYAASDAFQRARPEAIPMERESWLLQERYGHAIAQRIMASGHIQGLEREVQMTSQSELWDALLPVVEALATLEVRYDVWGSIASSVTGVARATLDADLVAALQSEHAEPLAALLLPHYYVDVEMIQNAMRQGAGFRIASGMISRGSYGCRRTALTWPTFGTGVQHSVWEHCCNGLWMRPVCQAYKSEVSHASC